MDIVARAHVFRSTDVCEQKVSVGQLSDPVTAASNEVPTAVSAKFAR